MSGPPPPQLAHPPPTDSALAGRSTTTATGTTPPKSGPTFLNYGPVASPFQQAVAGRGVADTTAGERASLEHPPGYVQAPDNAPYTAGGGIAGQAGGVGGPGDHEGVGATAWGMLSKAGEALKSGEEAVWRAVKGK